MNISLGYEVNDDPRKAGREVSVPLKHTAVLGQTQESGKTTTQEAMIMRSGLRAIAFITKRGEKSFRVKKPIAPFFREPHGDYSEYVIAICEGILDVRLGWQEKGWITKLCEDYEGKAKKKEDRYSWEQPSSLTDLMANVEEALPHLRGVGEIVCMQLRKYLRAIIPEIKAAGFTDKLQLHPGINVMDISRLSTGLQALVIRSVIEWVHEREKRIIVIIPEAWKFVAQSRSTPVKLAAIRFIREMAGIKNFLWLDSQDLRGVDKEILRSVPVYLFGVQREKNEVANTLDSIPDHPKPLATDIMRLGKGQFYVACGTTCVKTYVRPYGMEEAHAQAIARGEESADSWTQIVRTLDEQNSEPESGNYGSTLRTGSIDASTESEEVATDDFSAEMACDGSMRDSVTGRNNDHPELSRHAPTDRADQATKEDEMWKERAEAAEAEVSRLNTKIDALTKLVQEHGLIPTCDEVAPQPSTATKNNGTIDLAAIYAYVKERASKDSSILHLLVTQPELRVQIKRVTIEADGSTLRGQLAKLIARDFFRAAQNGNTAFNELIRLGRKVSKPNVYRECDNLAEMGFLTKEADGYKAVPGMKVNIVEAR